MLRNAILALVLLASFVAVSPGRTIDDIKEPAESATRAELEKWLIRALGKYGKHKTHSMSVSIASAKFEGCVLSLEMLHKPNSIDTRMDRTVYRTKKVTHTVSIDLVTIAEDGLTTREYLDADLRTIVVGYPGGVEIEVVVQREAAASMRNVFERLRGECRPAS